MRRASRHWPLVAGPVLVALGWWWPHVEWAATILLISLGVLVGLVVVTTNPGKALGWVGAYVFLTRAEADWRAVRRAVLVVVVLVACVFAPDWTPRILIAAGLGLVAGWAVRPAAAHVRVPFRRPGAPDLELGDAWGAWRFRRTYPARAAELGWDRNRRGAVDRMRVPALIEVRRKDGDWTCVFLSRGDWTPDEWETQAHALRRSLDGRTVRVSHQGRRVVVQVWTRPLPTPGEIVVSEPPRITRDGILIGHDAGRSEMRWAADDNTAHALIVGAPGGGKSHLAGLMVLQAAATPGWEGVFLDAKETRKWEWLGGYGVRVIRRRTEIHEYLRWLEGERQRVEDAGTVDVTRLVMLDEARLGLGTHPGPDRAQRLETIAVAGDLTGLGRSAGIRGVFIIQRPDVEHIGGGFLRDNLTLRIALGRLEGDGLGMVFEGRQVSPEERVLLDGTPGRAIVSGLRGGDMDGYLLQVPELRVQRAGGGAPARPVIPEPPAPAATAPGGWTLDGMMAAVLATVPVGGTVRRSRVAHELGVSVDHGTLRRAVADLTARGVLVEGRGPRGAVTLMRPDPGGSPTATGPQLRLVHPGG